VLTLFIGANDVCVGACHYEQRFDAEEFGTYLREILSSIRTHIPRVLVNVVRASLSLSKGVDP
jgi:lysophospholipase L1-like esterase